MIAAARHPRPLIAEGVCYGRLDVGLADLPAMSATQILAQLGRDQPERIVTSPLRRASDVARQIAARIDRPLLVEPRLSELDFGCWEGVEWRQIARGEVDAWAADPLGYRPGGGECVAAMYDRIASFWSEASIAQNRQLWITHAGPLRCLSAIAQRAPIDRYLGATFDYCQVVRLTQAVATKREQ